MVEPPEASEAHRNKTARAAWDAIHTLRDTVPISFCGLGAKVRAWRYLHKDIKEQADELVYSLANDVAVMSGLEAQPIGYEP
jgi:hypothetical protein